MKVLYKWKECFRFSNRSDGYYIEIHKSEINDILLSLLKKSKENIQLDERYFEQVNDWATSNAEWGLANIDCIYILVDKNVTTAFLCAVYYPYSGQWNDSSPFMYLYNSELKTKNYLKNTIQIEKLEDIKRIDEIIVSKGYTIKDDF